MTNAAPPTAGTVRERAWDALARAHAAVYPLPPHGHHPNFRGARAACQRLLSHPDFTRGPLLIGAERTLMPARKLALAAGLSIIVPDVRGRGYYRVTDEAGADLRRLPALGERTDDLGSVTAVILASAVVARDGARLSKGFGWGAHGTPLNVPHGTVAHPLMLLGALPCVADSFVHVIATPQELLAPRER
ncbi:hypothetical protein [Deinococcus maricopensis]|uniref:5-formyltetrahydrofolate cyclo-ligase n=1 Tax=Deinococcus maricopensis (strain DSM 21211 / LMG 22137 / NRRL B-23946 / LB-34) TaxID=709986 RepID=E8U5L6_DEIML|nr:hypothetical protein [Deinococcus maricopensis]ADV66355.1 hypothetical protein Deima_0699 [Deinococcus maricopensis DSM 21211]